MSNIHRLNENNNDNNDNNNQNRRNISIFGSNPNSNHSNPREESFCSFVRNLCPNFKFLSFILIITLIDIIMYVITLSYDGIDDVEKSGLLAPTFKALDFFGMSVNKTILKLELSKNKKW